MMVFKTAGRAARWIGRKASTSPVVATGAIGGAAVMGGFSAISDPSGPYGAVQEQALGDRNALRATIRAGAAGIMDSGDSVYGRGDYYYGRRVNPRSSQTQPVSGDVVLGLYNLR